MSLIGSLLRIFVQRQASDTTPGELIDRLETSGEIVTGRLAAAPDTPGNREVACHVIGIERWGDRRLRMALGEPVVTDEYDGYRPSLDLEMAALAQAFVQTRAETVALANQAAHLPESVRAPHNDLGELTVPEWLVYLDSHAMRETKRRLRS